MTKHQVRAYVLAAFLGSLFIAYFAAASQVAKGVEDQRVVCESNNDGRESELGQRTDLLLNALARSADPTTRQEGLAALARAADRRADLIDSVTDPIAPGSIRRDCRAAYRKPWPFNWLE